ncbi:protein E6-like [Juglans microcarpa x Juglans regia]|uniref:protein E6-like n=1 Tax=Juglans microcarpa x Juglans regia TaxID=2249226 RepID=UPI001B7E17C2|nr:protein E6-like [Juglans microcarpa x Juglans regia]
MAASSAKLFSFLFLITLSFSVQIYARESQFFSKVTNVNIPAKERTAPPKKEETTSSEQEDQDQPAFIPDAQGGYGLYGHESTELSHASTTLTNVNAAPYTTTPTNVPYKTQFTSNPTNVPYKNEFEDEESLNKYLNANDNNDNKNNYYNGANQYYNNNNYYNNKINRNRANQNDLVNTRLTEKEYTTTTTPTANENNYYSGANQYRQGMSDTRFLENGKYYYDLNNENLNYNPNQYAGNSRAVNPRNGYGNKVYYGNRENSFENNKSMEGYQNEEEFQEEQGEFVP